ncbi:hypothetical protein [Maricaulis sp.]|uniref:hypothetical protein n=1 Tax=Maricaulis sp. TaxID=1486257 RepID=UPI0026284359|nr:hypothetical protein [Maricaulis sp.]
MSMISAVVAMAYAALPAHVDDPGGDEIFATCLARGGEHDSCHCVSREAHSRFTAEELAVVVIAADPQLSSEQRAERLRARGANPTSLSSVTRRLVAAEPVIQQACGAGILRMRGE